MKTKFFFIALALTAITFTGCKSSQVATQATTQEQLGNKEVVLPCAGFDRDTEEYFAGMGIGENVNMQNARLAALNGAKQMINAKIGGLAKGISTDYSRTMSGNAVQQDVQGVVEREITQVIERMLNDAEQTCEKMYQTQNGTYQSFIAIRISKKELAQKTASALGENEKLETLFSREQFRKWAEEYLKNYNSGK